jgi:DNA-binding FadR family transcriptional regulator
LFSLGSITPEQLTEARVRLERIVVEAAAPRLTSEDMIALEANLEATQHNAPPTPEQNRSEPAALGKARIVEVTSAD